MIVIDSHLDLSWNVLNWNRDLEFTVAEIRNMEYGLSEKGDVIPRVAAFSTSERPLLRQENCGPLQELRRGSRSGPSSSAAESSAPHSNPGCWLPTGTRLRSTRVTLENVFDHIDHVC